MWVQIPWVGCQVVITVVKVISDDDTESWLDLMLTGARWLGIGSVVSIYILNKKMWSPQYICHLRLPGYQVTAESGS